MQRLSVDEFHEAAKLPLIVVLDEGNVVGLGTHDELIKSCDVYREICLSQVKEDEAK